MSVAQLRNSKPTSGRLMAVLFSLLFVFAVACGDDDGNNGTSNNSNNTVRDGGGDQDAGGRDVTEEDGGGQDATDDAGGDTSPDASGECMPLDPAPADQADCSILCQDCADGSACVRGTDPASGDTVMACQPTGTAGQGEVCNQSTPCQAGFGCFIEEQGSTEGTCRAFCRMGSDDAPQCGDNEACLQIVQGDDRFGACFSTDNNCEPYPNDTCGDTQTCSPSPSSNECVDFNPDASAGDSCTATRQCNNQQACTNFGGGGECFNLCEPQAGECADGERCNGVLFEEGGDPQYFVCQAAQ